MRRLLIAAACMVLWAGTASAQIEIKLPGGGTGSGDIDPAQVSSPDGTITVGGSVGALQLSCNGAVCVTYSTSTGSNPATCTPGAMFNLRTDLGTVNACPTADTWKALAWSNQATDTFGALTDITTNNASTSAHGFLPKLDNNAAHYMDGTGNWSTPAGGSTFDPGTTLEMFEDFLTGGSAAGTIGANGLGSAVVGGGTITNLVASTAANPGLFRLSSHISTDNSGAIVAFQNSQGQGPNAFSGTEWSFDAVVIFGSNSTAITNTGLIVGMLSSASGDTSGMARGIWVRHDSDLADTTFVFVVCNAAGAAGCNSAGDAANAKTVASTITPSAGTAYRFRIRRVAAGVGGNPTIYFRVNGETEKTFCSSGCDDTLGTLDTGNYQSGIAYLTRTTTGVMSSDIDYMYLRMTGLSRY